MLPACAVHQAFISCKHLPQTFCPLIALQHLILDKSDLEYLPEEFGIFAKMNYLSMEHCKNLTNLSPGFGSLSSPIYLNPKGCENLKATSEDFGELSHI